MEESDKEAASRANGTAKAAGLRSKGRILHGIMITVGVILLVTFVRGLLPTGSAPHTDVAPPVVKVPVRTSHCPDAGSQKIGNEAVRIDTVAGCRFIFGRQDYGPDLLIWVNGDESTAKRWTATGSAHFDGTVYSVEVKLADSGSEKVLFTYRYPPKQ